jgi:tRNA(Ile)-lysidine synthase
MHISKVFATCNQFRHLTEPGCPQPGYFPQASVHDVRSTVPTPHSIPAALAAAWSPAEWADVTVLLAVSAGADSVALLRAMGEIRPAGAGRLVVAHFNHRLRGAASDADAAFVHDLAAGLGLSCEIGHADDATGGVTGKSTLAEEHSRTQRYDFLTAAARRHGARYVATAHTADDQAETVLHRIIRGTGLAGLAGIPRARELSPGIALVRPLLGLRRHDLIDYLHALGQPFREDASNADTRYTRNRIRHELLPHLADQYNPGIIDALLRLSTLAGEAQATIDPLARDLTDRCIARRAADHLTIDCRVLRVHSRYLAREALLNVWREQGWPLAAMGYDQWELLAAMVADPPSLSHHDFPGAIRAQRRGHDLDLSWLPAADHIVFNR